MNFVEIVLLVLPANWRKHRPFGDFESCMRLVKKSLYEI